MSFVIKMSPGVRGISHISNGRSFVPPVGFFHWLTHKKTAARAVSSKNLVLQVHPTNSLMPILPTQKVLLKQLLSN